MNMGSIKIEETGLTNGHPAVIISGTIKEGTVCETNGLLSLNKAAGKFEAYDFTGASRAACIALEPIAAYSADGAAKVLLHGTFNGDKVVKADGNPLTAAELAIVQTDSQIYFV